MSIINYYKNVYPEIRTRTDLKETQFLQISVIVNCCRMSSTHDQNCEFVHILYEV